MTTQLHSIEREKEGLEQIRDQQHLQEIFLKHSSWYDNTQAGSAQDHLEIIKMADRFWKSMPAALKMPTLDELYRRLRDLDYTQVDERMAVMLNAILHLEEQVNAGSLQQKRF